MPDSLSHQPLEAVIASTVALDHALGQQLYPQARHHARITALRATHGGFETIAQRAQAVMDVLSQAIRPERTVWAPALEALHASIDRAIEAPPDAHDR